MQFKILKIVLSVLESVYFQMVHTTKEFAHKLLKMEKESIFTTINKCNTKVNGKMMRCMAGVDLQTIQQVNGSKETGPKAKSMGISCI